MVQSGCVPLVVARLSNRDTALSAAAAQAVGGFASTAAGRQHMIGAGAIPPLVRLLGEQDSEGRSLAAAQALALLAAADPHYQSMMVDAGLLDVGPSGQCVLCPLLDSSDSAAVAAALHLVRALSSTDADYRQQLADGGVVPSLLKASAPGNGAAVVTALADWAAANATGALASLCSDGRLGKHLVDADPK